MDSKVRRNLDKPCRTVPVPTCSHSAVKEGRSEIENKSGGAIPSDPLNNLAGDTEDAFRDISDGDLTNRQGGFTRQYQPDILDMPSPSQSCNASQIMMKSLMKSYNAGNVQFYENLHRKYFDKAKGNKEENGRPCEPPSQLLDMTADGDMTSRNGEELSRFMADSHLNDGSRSRSRSRGNGGFGKASMPRTGTAVQDGFPHVSKTNMELDQTQGAQTVAALDDTHLFELTEKSNNTYMAYNSQFNNNQGGLPQQQQQAHLLAKQMACTQEAYQMDAFGKHHRGGGVGELSEFGGGDHETHSKLDNESSNNAMSINFKNSIYSKIKYDPSVHNFAPSMISARHMAMHSDASASQISTMGLTSKILGRNGGVATHRYHGRGDGRTGSSLEDAESEVPASNSFLTRQKLLSSSSSPEIDIEEVMLNRQQPHRSRLGSNSRGNKSVPNIREVVDGVSKRYGIDAGNHHHHMDELSRRDLSARLEEDPDRVTNFELGTSSPSQITHDEGSPRQFAFNGGKIMAYNNGTGYPTSCGIGAANVRNQTDFSEKVQNLMSPETQQQQDLQFGGRNPAQQRKATQPNVHNIDDDDTSSSFLKQLQGLGSPESTSNLSYQPSTRHHHNLVHKAEQDDRGEQLKPSTSKQATKTVSRSTTPAMTEPQTLTKVNTNDLMTSENLPMQQPKQAKDKTSAAGASSLLQTFQEQVRLARQRNQSQHNSAAMPITPEADNQKHDDCSGIEDRTVECHDLSTDQQAQLISQQYESVPLAPKGNLLFKSDQVPQQRLFTGQKESNEAAAGGPHLYKLQQQLQQHQNSISQLDGDGHRSDFTFVLSQPTQGGFTECHNCGAANGSIMLDNINGSILQSHGLRSSLGDTSMQIRKKVLTNFYQNNTNSGPPIPPGAPQQQQLHQNHQNTTSNNGYYGCGTASFPDGVLGGGGGAAAAVNTSITNFQSAQSSEQRANQRSEITSQQLKTGGGLLRNRLPEIAASPIYSESGGAPGRKFFMSLNNQQAAGNMPQFSMLQQNNRLDYNLLEIQKNNNRAGVETAADINRRQTNLICDNDLRLSQIQEDHVMLSPDGPPTRIQQRQNFDLGSPQDAQDYHSSDQKRGSPAAAQDDEEASNLHELFAHQQMELNQARSLLICSYEHMQHLLQQGWTQETFDETVKLMQVIAGTTTLMLNDGDDGDFDPQNQAVTYGQQAPAGVANAHGHQMMIPEAIENEEEDDEAIGGHRFNEDQEASQNQMTESKFQDRADNSVDRVFLMPKQLEQQQQKQQNKKSANPATAPGETHRGGKTKATDQLEVKHLKNSLLSSAAGHGDVGGGGGTATLYNDDLDKDTVYSFFAEESEIRPRGYMQQFKRDDPREQDDNDQHHQTSFIASQHRSSPPGNGDQQERRRRGAPFLANGRDEELDALAQTKSRLKTERRINRAQADMLVKMQAQIDLLTQKWSITETQLRNTGAIYSAMWQPGQSSPPFGNNTNMTSTMWHPTATGTISQLHPSYHNRTGGATGGPFYSLLGGVANQHGGGGLASGTSPVLDGGAQQQRQTLQQLPQMQASPFAPHQQTATSVHSLQSLANNNNKSREHQPQNGVSQAAEQQSRHLIEINQQLSQQIENNISILENIQDAKLQHQSSSLQEQSIEKPQQTPPNNGAPSTESMQSLITLTKITAEASLQAHQQHIDEMQKLRKRQQLLSAKYEQLSSINSIASSQKAEPAGAATLQSNKKPSLQQTKVGLKKTISRASASTTKKNTLEQPQNKVEEGDGNVSSSTFIDFTDDKEVPTKD